MNGSIKSYATSDLILLLIGPLAGRQSKDPTPSRNELQQLVRMAQLSEEVIEPLLDALESFHRATKQELDLERGRLYSAAQACPACEAAYIRREKGALLADIAGFYNAFGLRLDSHAHERPDHIVMELEFLALAFVMLGNSQREGNVEAQSVCWRAIAKFANEHLGEWIESFATVLHSASADHAHPAIANALGVFWGALRNRECWSGPSCPAARPVREGLDDGASNWDCVVGHGAGCHMEDSK